MSNTELLFPRRNNVLQNKFILEEKLEDLYHCTVDYNLNCENNHQYSNCNAYRPFFYCERERPFPIPNTTDSSIQPRNRPGQVFAGSNSQQNIIDSQIAVQIQVNQCSEVALEQNNGSAINATNFLANHAQNERAKINYCHQPAVTLQTPNSSFVSKRKQKSAVPIMKEEAQRGRHRLVEQQRRKSMNKSIDRLKELMGLPALQKGRRFKKSNILEMACEHIEKLHTHIASLNQQLANNLDKRREFNDHCAANIIPQLMIQNDSQNTHLIESRNPSIKPFCYTF